MKDRNVSDLAVIIQCRLSSTRLPGKALKMLGGKTVFEWTMDSMKKVSAGYYIVATDEESYPELKPLSEKHGWKIVKGPLNDVLERYCIAIRSCNCKTVLRATADNPFLFYEAAEALVTEYFKQNEKKKCDYMTWTGLPHGSGVEIFDAASLLDASTRTSDPYDHEHVGPALYNHKNIYTSLFYKAPARFYHPDFRTTIDTPSDYRRAISIVSKLSNGIAPKEPYTTEEIISAVNDPDVHDTVLFYPSCEKGHGTGHLRRCLKCAREINGFVYIPENPELTETGKLLEEALNNGLNEYQIIRKEPEINEFALIVVDYFATPEELLNKLRKAAKIVCIDEGGKFHDCADYLLDIIPSYNLQREANLNEPCFIDKPSVIRQSKVSEIKSVLICIGGEDPSGLTEVALNYFNDEKVKLTVIASSETFPREKYKSVTFKNNVPELKNKLSEFDLVVTHYGLTAFEAAIAGCAVILLPTTRLHENLAKKYDFFSLSKSQLELKIPEDFYGKTDDYIPESFVKKIGSETKNLSSFIKELSHGKRYYCPVCSEKDARDEIIARTPERTFRRCKKCGMIYISWNASKPMKYEKEYFAEQYKAQYGRTYLEDFESIKKNCHKRMLNINGIIRGRISNPRILDIGCAYGPFLSAACENGWQPYGTDIASDAVEYVRKKLLFPAVQSVFPDFSPAAEFGLNQFDAVTMWFVIEHFSDLNAVLEKVSSLVRKGGVFAFSTPSGEGVSAKKNRKQFFEKSPSDHFSIWEPGKTAFILKKYGFKVEKIVSTGHHPERFPEVAKHGWKKGDFMFGFYNLLSQKMNLGDTFEVYCRKI